MKTSNWLGEWILDFLSVIDRCRKETSFAEDRRLYKEDMAHAAGWLVRLHQGEEVSSVAGDILDPATDKSFTDYWKGGEWGDREAEALAELQNRIKQELG